MAKNSDLRDSVDKLVKNNFAKRVHIAPNIPEKQLRNATAKMGIPDGSDVLVLVDDSLSKSGKAGICVTSDGIYWKKFLTKGSVKFDEIKRLDMKLGFMMAFKINEKEISLDHFSKEEIQPFADFLRAVVGPEQKYAHARKKYDYPRTKKFPSVRALETKKDVEGLIKALKHEDKDVRFKAALGLGEVRDTRAVEPLIQALNDKSSTVRWRAALSLGEIGDRRAVEPLNRVLKDESGDVQKYAAEALAMLGETQQFLIALERLLRSGMGRVKIDAAEKLVDTCGIEAVPILTNALKDDDPGVYDAAAWGIQIPLMTYRGKDIGEERLQKALIPATEYLISIVEGAKISMGARSFDEYIARAIGTLGAIGDLRAIPALEKILAKVQNKIEREGVVREYVDTGIAAGYISTKDDISHIERAIENIRKEGGKRPDISLGEDVEKGATVATSPTLRDAFSACELGEYNTSRKMYEILTNLNPRLSIAWYNLGVTEFRAGRWASAANAFDRVVKLKEHTVAGAYAWLRCQEKRGRPVDKAPRGYPSTVSPEGPARNLAHELENRGYRVLSIRPELEEEKCSVEVLADEVKYIVVLEVFLALLTAEVFREEHGESVRLDKDSPNLTQNDKEILDVGLKAVNHLFLAQMPIGSKGTNVNRGKKV